MIKQKRLKQKKKINMKHQKKKFNKTIRIRAIKSTAIYLVISVSGSVRFFEK